MLFNCFKCHSQQKTVGLLCLHLKQVHYFRENNFLTLECRNCCRNKFHTFNGFKKHLNKLLIPMPLPVNEIPLNVVDSNNTIENSEPPEVIECPLTITESNIPKENEKDRSMEVNVIANENDNDKSIEVIESNETDYFDSGIPKQNECMEVVNSIANEKDRSMEVNVIANENDKSIEVIEFNENDNFDSGIPKENECMEVVSSIANEKDRSMEVNNVIANENDKSIEVIEFNETDYSDSGDSTDTASNYDNSDTDVVEENLHKYVRTLYSLRLPETTITEIIKANNALFSPVLDQIVSEENIEERKNVSNKFQCLFQNQQSQHLRSKIFKDSVIYPVRKAHGIRYDQKFDKTLKLYKTVTVTCTFSYIPILETLKFLLNTKLPNYFVKDTSSDDYNHFKSGSVFKNSAFFKENPNALLLQLFFDEYDVCNPLGAKKCIHKLAGLYFTLINLPLNLNSCLQNIHLLALCYNLDIKSFGINPVLDVIFRDIKTLESEGIYVENLETNFKGTVVSFSHDNLGGATCFGLAESFNSNYYCRICTMPKEEAQKSCKANNNLLRTAESFVHAANALHYANSETFNLFGVKNESSLFKLKHFNPCKNPTVDILHDGPEGSGQRDLKVLFQYLVDNKICNIIEINDRIKSYSYNHLDRANFPTAVTISKDSNSIGLNGIQTWYLLIHIPFIFRDLLPILDKTPVFTLILLMIKIMKTITAFRISKENLKKLELAIEDHHQILLNELHLHLIPKDHMLTHYPFVIETMGPPRSYWTMRYESKNGFFVDLAQRLKNFIDVGLTLAKRHQIYMSNEWKNPNFLDHSCFLKKATKVSLKYQKYSEIISKNLNIHLNEFILEGHKVELKNCNLLLNYFFCANIEKDLPIFGKSLYFFSYDSIVYVVFEEWKTLKVSEYNVAYVVQNSQKINVKGIKDLPYTKCWQVMTAEDGNYVLNTDSFL